MSDYTIYALRGAPDLHWCNVTFKSLKEGEGRFGWSYIPTANLHELEAKIKAEGKNSLSEEEQDCYQRFLLDIKKNDYVVYINLPEWGKCTLARVTSPYFWHRDGADFNHRFYVDTESIFVFDRNDAIVHPTLRRRLKLQGRFWRIYSLHEEFENLVETLKEGKQGSHSTLETNLHWLVQEIQPDLKSITKKIQRTHPNFDLEGLLEEIFKKVPGVQEVIRHRGKADHGADLTVVFESGLPIPGFQQQSTCVVQVKSFIGELRDTKAVKDIRRAFGYYPEADMGLIVSTADSCSEKFVTALNELEKEEGKPVSLLIGEDVAAFVLRFGGLDLF